MSIPVNDVVSIEQAGEILVRAINAGDISALSDFFAADAIILAPARPAIEEPNIPAFLRNMALQNEGLRLMSDAMLPFGADAVRDTGTLSLRIRRQNSERVAYKYLMLWQKVGDDWKLASMVWNRAPAGRRGQAVESGDDDGGM